MNPIQSFSGKAACLALSVFLSAPGAAEAGWLKTYGTAAADSGYAWSASGGGYFLSLTSSDESTGTHASLFARLNDAGNLSWARKIQAGPNDEFFLSELPNGRILLQGTTRKTATASKDAVWAIYNLNRATGALTPVASKVYRGQGEDYFGLHFDETGNALLGVGSTSSFNTDPQSGDTDILVAKFSPANGALVWSKVLHGDANDSAIQLLPAGQGYVLLASTGSGIQGRVLVGKLGANGGPVSGSFASYGDSGHSLPTGLYPVAGGGYVIIGSNQVLQGASYRSDAFVIKLGPNLEYLWGKRLSVGTGGVLSLTGASEREDGSLVLSGGFFRYDGGELLPRPEALAVRLAADGDLLGTHGFEDLSGYFSRNHDGGYSFSGTGGIAGSDTGQEGDLLYGQFDAGFHPLWLKRLAGPWAEYGSVTPRADGYFLSGGTTSWGAGQSELLAGVLDGKGEVAGCTYIGNEPVVETTPNITASNLNWKPKAAKLSSRGSIKAENISLTVAKASLKATTVCSGVPVAGPDITVSPSTVVFGDTGVGQTATAEVVVRNDGGANLKLGTVGVPKAPFGKTADTCSGKTLAPGKTCRLTYSFKPAAAGSASGNSKVPSNDPDENPFGIALKGKGIAATGPDITVTPAALNFGQVAVGGSKTLQVTVRNDGAGTLSIMQVSSPLGGPPFPARSASRPILAAARIWRPRKAATSLTNSRPPRRARLPPIPTSSPMTPPKVS
jgi:hypothetical protein